MAQCRMIQLVLAAAVAAGQRCLDNTGADTSWWFMLKLPHDFTYAYVDATTSRSSFFKPYKYTMDDADHPSALTRTLMALADKPLVETAHRNVNASGAVPYLLYSDQPPPDGSVSSTYGHSKGVIAASGTGGLWIMHSTPHFPSADGKAQFWFPESETRYGQTFLCMSLDSADIDKVGTNLLFNRPYIYKNTFSASEIAAFPKLKSAVAGEWVTAAGTNTLELAAHTPGYTFTAFAKNSAWDDDLYEGLIAPHYKTDLMVESWIRGSSEGTYCRPKYTYEVVDVESLQMVGRDGGANISWSEGQDHAKWAVSLGSDQVLCVADINRMKTQRKRGGGAVCFSDSALSDSLYNCVVTSHVCKK